MIRNLIWLGVVCLTAGCTDDSGGDSGSTRDDGPTSSDDSDFVGLTDSESDTPAIADTATAGNDTGSDFVGLTDSESDTPAIADTATAGNDTDTDTALACTEGISAGYPDDIGIGDHPDVIFADDFEGYADESGLAANWNDGVYHNVSIATEPANVYTGERALEFFNPEQEAELSNTVARVLDEELDVLYLRYCSKFDAAFDVVGSSHNGGGMSAHYYVDGQATPGIPADGTNKFLATFECWRGEEAEPNPGSLNVYIYHPEQRSEWGDHFFPDGTVLPLTYIPGEFGDDFVPRPAVVPELDRWYCYELMVRANTPGERDGRITVWVDGEIVGDFGNLRLRDVPELKLDRFNLSLHIGSNTRGETRKWYDNVVAATSYIGPVCRAGR